MSDLRWKARWISYGSQPSEDLGVFWFRRTFKKPASGRLVVRVSADQRYQLRCNGQFVGDGPQRGDLQHWYYETCDLSDHLVEGENQLDAVVWSFGRHAPMAQHSYRLAFVLEGEGVSTPDGWEVAKLTGHDFAMMHNEVGGFYIDIGPGEIMTAPAPPVEWRKPNEVSHVLERGEWAGDSPWFLIPRSLPAMKREAFEGRPQVVDRQSNARSEFHSLMVHPGEKVLLDFGELLAAYPQINLEGQTGTTVRVTYGEGLFDEHGQKLDRNDVRGKRIRGYQDKIVLGNFSNPDARGVAASTLWWRTWRYMQLESDQPVSVRSVEAVKTGYPYKVESSFTGDDPWIEKIWEVGVRTAELCAGETYFDCPYYEQLQYVGDTRIQALIHMYLSRDRRLQRNAVEQFSRSVTCDGLTQSRYPSRVMQLIPTFSLWWILMVDDQAHYDQPVTAHREEAARVLAAARRWIEDGPEHWPFSDWVGGWPMGIAPGGRSSTLVRLLWLLAARSLGQDWPGLKFGQEDGLVRLKGDQEWKPSEHAEALARLLDGARGRPAAEWPTDAIKKHNAAACTYYFQYYKHLAMQPDDYLQQLEPWKEMIRNGLTTFAEAPEPTRSDCHAWSAHPLLGFFQMVAGVTSAAHGWQRARIAPKPGKLRNFDAKLAHPDGDLTIRWDGASFTVESPVPYEFHWKGKAENHEPGKQKFSAS
ncbi:MAG: family 78 glycoside hydrolase catalytic domain [Armatimonadetes bacterium]|nr:family 78 glycoside hydrolase catalytic domain [Armatimonadota bacterium]